MVRRVIAGLIAVGLGLGIWALWPRSNGGPDPMTSVPVADPTTSTTSEMTTTTFEGTTSTTLGSHMVETVEEAEAILRQLWFGWFEGIYNQDEDRIREVVGNAEQVDAAVAQFGQMEFLSPPSPLSVVVDRIEFLRSDSECLAVYASVDASALTGAVTEGVHVFRSVESRWLFYSFWALRNDLWEADCDAQLQP